MQIHGIAPTRGQPGIRRELAVGHGGLQLRHDQRLQRRQPDAPDIQLAVEARAGEIQLAARMQGAAIQLGGHVQRRGRRSQGGKSAQAAVQVVQADAGTRCTGVGVIEVTLLQVEQADPHIARRPRWRCWRVRAGCGQRIEIAVPVGTVPVVHGEPVQLQQPEVVARYQRLHVGQFGRAVGKLQQRGAAARGQLETIE